MQGRGKENALQAVGATAVLPIDQAHEFRGRVTCTVHMMSENRNERKYSPTHDGSKEGGTCDSPHPIVGRK
jgi:hypothetical protein